MNWKGRYSTLTGLLRPRSRTLALGASLLAFGGAATAQLSTLQGSYDFATTTGAYAPLIGGEVAYSFTPPGESGFFGTTYNNQYHYTDPGAINGFGPNFDSFLSAGYPLPFNFTYNGVTWDRITVSKAGYITFGSSLLAVPVWHNQQLGTEVFGSATNPSTAGPTGYYRGEVIEQRSRVGFVTNVAWGKSPGIYQIKLGTQGTAPNRTYVAQFENFEIGGATQTGNFQIRLKEGGGNPNNQTVQIAFGSFTWTGSNQTSVGLAGSTNADWYTLQGSFAAPTLGASSAATQTLSGSDFPASGRIYTWSPKTTACVPAAIVPASGLRPTSAVIQWVDNGASSHDYELRAANISGFGPDALPGSPLPVPGGFGNVPTGTFSVTVSGLTANTKYYAYVRSTCSVAGAWSLAGCFTTPIDCASPFVQTAGNAYGANRLARICPTTPGQAAVATFSALNLANFNSDRLTRLYVYNGPNTSNDQIYNSLPGGGLGTSFQYYPPGGLGAANTAPLTITSSDPSGCLTFKLMSFQGASWTSSVTCAALPTCFPPTAVSITPNPQGGTVTWTSSAPQNQYRVVTNGALVTAPALVQGITSTVPFTITDAALVGGTTYTMYVRGVCAPGDTSAWGNPSNFTTAPGCGGPFKNAGYEVFTNYPLNTDATYNVCPNTLGDVVTVAFTDFSVGSGDRFYVYDGPTTASGLLASSTAGVGAFPAGGFTGTALPGPFTSTHPSGCLTFRLRANGQNDGFGVGGEHGFLANVTCAPAPPCQAPNAVTISQIQGTSAQVSWTGAGNYIVEYGAPGFTPGTGATAGVGGTVIINATTPRTISGLSTTTAYKVVVRKICSGPTYSANSFPVNFSTSMDCSTAVVLACGELTTATVVSGVAGNTLYDASSYTNASCMTTLGGTGLERLYRFNAPTAGTYRLNVPVNLNGSQMGFVTTPVSNGCGAAAFTCLGINPSATGPGTPAAFFDLPLSAGDHYLLMDPNLFASGSPQFQVFCPGIPPCIPAPTFPPQSTSLALSATPIPFSWPAAFGASVYDIFFQGPQVANDHPTNSITSPSYTPNNIQALYGIGTNINWHASGQNASGVATCPDWSFIVGGNGSANAIPLTNGVVKGGSTKPAAGYTNLQTYVATSSPSNALFGRDITYSFTASACSNGISVTICPRNHSASNGATYVAVNVVSVASGLTVAPTNEGNTSAPNCRTFSLSAAQVQPGQSYLIVVDSYFSEFDLSIVYNEVPSTVDTDSDGLLDCADNCPETPGVVGGTCYLGPLFSNATINGDCECVGTPVECTTTLTLEFQTDANPEQTTWELYENGTNFLVFSGGPLSAENSFETNFACVPDGCYYLRVLDSAGDGMTTGGYTLRTLTGNQRIIDNKNNFNSAFNGSVSAISGGQGFCVPLGTGRPIFASCDKTDWVNYQFLVATENVAVSAQFGVSNTTSGYEFWFFDPNGSYSFRRFRNHATTDGTGIGATRACHFKINGWINSALTPHLPASKLLNVRIRGRVNGVDQAFGPACLFKIDLVAAACPLVKLQDNPLNTADFSCGVSKTFGGGASPSNRITANPPQFSPAATAGSIRYQFRFRIPGEYPAAGSCIIRPPQTSATLNLNWTTGDRLKCSTQYDVDVRVSKDGGLTWCVDGASPSCAPVSLVEWGKMCKVNITTSTYCPQNLTGGGSSSALDDDAHLTMYPNPNRGDQLFVNISSVAPDVNTVSVDIYDLTGKRVEARTIAVQDGFVNTAMDLNGALANGIYLVNFIVGTKTYTERLVMQH